MDWAVMMMQKVCKVFSTPGERNNFLQSVENAFAHVIMDALQSMISGKEYSHRAILPFPGLNLDFLFTQKYQVIPL